jgi:arginyl-tRNA synthetase
MVDRLKESGQAVESEGAIIIPFPEDEKGKSLLPLLLVKSDGASLYATTDLAAIEERVHDDHFQMILYVVDARQSLHFQQVFAAAKQTGIALPETELRHLGYGTVNGPDGKPFKTRAGTAMLLDDLIDLTQKKAFERMKEAGVGSEYPQDEQEAIARAVAVAALKYADLSNNKASDYSFDIDSVSRFEGKTGPYLVYTAVRIKSIFRKLDNPQTDPSDLRIHGESERNLVLVLADFASAIQRTKELDAPHVLCEYLFELGQVFNRFYQECNISKQENEEIKKAWISLSSLTLKTLETGLDLLGIAVPERM